MIKLPYINTRAHLKSIMQRYDEYVSEYNGLIEQQKKATGISERQTLKPTHRALFTDLVFEAGARMLERIGEYEKISREQGEADTLLSFLKPIDSESGIMLRTNRKQLSKRSGKEVSTIYRNIRRLMEAGIINSIANHGKYSDFELFINSDFLFISDHSNPAYNPIMAGSFFSAQLLAKCKVENIKQEHLLNKINSANAENTVNFTETAAAGYTENSTGKIEINKPTADKNTENTVVSTTIPLQTRTLTGTEGNAGLPTEIEKRATAKRRNWKPTGGPADGQNLLHEAGINPINPEKTADTKYKKQDYLRISYAQMIVNYMIDKIYTRRMITIYPEARLKAIDYMIDYYFPDPFNRDKSVITPLSPCVTFKDYVYRAEMLKWCIDAANRYAAKNNAFFTMPNRWIDTGNPAGFFRTLKWYAKAKQREADKALHARNREDIRKLQNQIKLVIENPDQQTLQRAENYVQTVLPKYIHLFRRTIAGTVNQLNELQKNKIDTGKLKAN